MQKTRLPIWGKVLIGVAVVAIAWAAFEDRQESARIRQLGSLPPCQLAAEYAKWRLAFEDEHPGDEVTGDAAEDFIRESEVFEQAVLLAKRSEQSLLLEELESVTAIDSARWIREKGDTDAFVEVLLSKCPDEVAGLISGAKR